MKSQSKNKQMNAGNDLLPLNTDFYDEFSLQELEERLETAPWICGVNAPVDCPGLECGVNNPTE